MIAANRLDDLYYYAMVIKHGGFAAAGRAIGMPKSRLSRHVNALEARLGVRLLQRSTRRFVVSETGLQLYRHCEAMLAEAEAALEVVELVHAEPRGRIRVACPVAVADSMLAPVLPQFLAQFPKVRVELQVSNRRVDVLGEGFDLALRVRNKPSGEDGLVMRSFAELCELLVASPAYLEAHGVPQQPADLVQHWTLAYEADRERQTWLLSGPDRQQARIEHQPRLSCHNFALLLSSALAGQGIALLPESVARGALARGELLPVLPLWSLPQGIFHVVYPHRRGLLPAVRVFVEFLVQTMPAAAQ